MKRNTLIAIALCLMVIATVGGAASSIAGKVSSLPGYADALAAAKGTTPGIAPSGSVRSLAGYQDVLDEWRGMPGAAPSGSVRSLAGYQDVLDKLRGMPGATVFQGTIKRAAGAPCYTLTYSDAYQTYTVYLRPHEITYSEGGSALPNTIPNPVALDYVGPIDNYQHTLDFRYQGVYYSAPYYISCEAPVPTVTGYYKPIKVYNDDIHLYEWKWYVNAKLMWTMPQEPMPVKAKLNIYYTTWAGNTFLGGSELEYPYLDHPINPPLVVDSSWLSTQCDYGPSDLKLCDNPHDFSPYTAIGTVWDSYGNAFTVTTTLVPDY